MNLLRKIIAVPASLAVFFIFDLVSPYLVKIVDVLEGNDPNSILFIATEYILNLIAVPAVSVYLAALIYGKIYPLHSSKRTVAIVYMGFLVIISGILIGNVLTTRPIVWLGIIKFSFYAIFSIAALVYAVKSQPVELKTQST